MSTKSSGGALPARWETTALWQELLKRTGPDADEARATIKICMKPIVQILDKGATSAYNFTLHDADHSFRVAERMVAIIPDEVLPELSIYELSLLLLSAFAHDIGMTPERSRVTHHYEFLLTGETSLLSEKERVEFRQWLDNQNSSSIAQAAGSKPTVPQLRQARELIAYYCRARHNEWSMVWIRSNLGQLPMGNYINWVEDLAQLCGSHHEGYKHLTAPRFDVRLIAAGQRIHMRYLACVLRVADVLEIDPGRTPPVILRHRAISDESVLHWHKDVTLALEVRNDEILAYARPWNAYLHKAIADTLDGIDQELETAFLISIENPFQYLKGSQTSTLPYKWVLPRKLTRNIAPRDGSYEYIDGAFRPDTAKLLEMLSGVELYESKWAALRELLQNAFDAVRIQIAWQRLNHTAPLDSAFVDNLRHIHTVKLWLEKAEEDGQQALWVICSDTGVGMTKGIIEKYLLVSGARRQPEVLELARRCKAAGFDLDATGQFGIGVLSYFMIADKFEIRTVRSREAGDPVFESTGWRFESEGVGSFGELRKDDTVPKGTVVRLRLRPEFVGEDIVEAGRKIEEYIEKLVRFVPCRFQFRSTKSADGEAACGPGWVQSSHTFRGAILEQLREQTLSRKQKIPAHLIPKSALQRQEERDSYWKKIHSKVDEALEIVSRDEVLPEGFGRMRIQTALFKLPQGMSGLWCYQSNPGEFNANDSCKVRICVPIGTLLQTSRKVCFGHLVHC